MTIEDRSHRKPKLNPRKHPNGTEKYPTTSKNKVWRQLHIIPMLSVPEQQLIQDMPRMLGEGNYANLGHAGGGSTILLADGLKEQHLHGKVYTVDLRFKKDAVEVLQRFGVKKRVQMCEGSTDMWAERLSAQVFNFVFIDADHCYDAVVKDFRNWRSMVKVGGMVCFHDTNQDFSHKAIETVMKGNSAWVERKDLHIHRIRTFERVS